MSQDVRFGGVFIKIDLDGDSDTGATHGTCVNAAMVVSCFPTSSVYEVSLDWIG